MAAPKNENILANVVVILQELQKYVPQTSFNNGQIKAHNFRKTIIGGDYLMAKGLEEHSWTSAMNYRRLNSYVG